MSKAEAAFAPPQYRQQPDPAGEETHGAVDPAEHPVDQARGQQHALTTGIADHFIGKASRLRDQLDELIRQQRADAERKHREDNEYADKARERADVLAVMSEAFRELSEPTCAKVQPTITALPRRERQNGTA